MDRPGYFRFSDWMLSETILQNWFDHFCIRGISCFIFRCDKDGLYSLWRIGKDAFLETRGGVLPGGEIVKEWLAPLPNRFNDNSDNPQDHNATQDIKET